jgi:hypothetical protein
MTIFDDREQAQERKYALNEELEFKATARRNKLLGLWAADKLGKAADEAETYAKDLVMADFESAGDGDIIQKLAKDFKAAALTITLEDIERELSHFYSLARQQIMGAA